MNTTNRSTTRSLRLGAPSDLPDGPLYVFGYGSLVWRPGFEYLRCIPARIYGFHRALRVWSWHHRGTEERPGLVLGLDTGGSCRGCVFEVTAGDKDAVAAYLWEREMVTSVYSPRLVPAYTATGPVMTLAFVLDREHPQYAGTLSPTEAARHIAGAEGLSGPNPEYVYETIRCLRDLGIDDHGLSAVLDQLEAH
ncbi:MAG: gamma-glutamylcyclotransferase [Halofilum sp. (in: g-proteobacteria)]